MLKEISPRLKRLFLSSRFYLRKYPMMAFSRRYLFLVLISIASLGLYLSLSQSFDVLTLDTGGPFRREFYATLFDAMQSAAPEGQLNMDIARDKERCKSGDAGAFSKDFEKTSFENLDACLHLSDEQLSMMSEKHEQYLNKMNSWSLTDDEKHKLFPNQRGVVTIGGGRFSVISLTMLETLRDRGTTLPVEVIIPPGDEGDDDYCNVVLPKLNAKCVYMSNVLPAEVLEKVEIKRFQNKVIGLLLSSFKEVVYVDADCLPLQPLDDVFDKPAYVKNGMILWPDIWKRVTAPAFYKVAKIQVDTSKRVRFGPDDVSPVSRYEPSTESNAVRMLKKVPYHDLEGSMPDPTTEAGQMVINKMQHLPSLLLSAYYNIYGKWYYKMLSQGTSGEGDKETFMAAAHVLKLPYYQVKSEVKFDGFSDKDGFHGISLYQQDFQQDYRAYKKAKRWVGRHKSEVSGYEQDYDVKRQFLGKLMRPDGKELDAMFGHIGYHKFEPMELSKKHIYVSEDGKHFRGFRRKEVIKKFDLELFNFGVLEKYLCHENPIKFVFYKNVMQTPEWDNMCKYLKNHTSFLEDTHEDTWSS
ncbi:MNN5 (YJL186W) [Zygosaccharomyces parabailii]|nr:MNN5 (YJL186W) [Zygosaccharomyces parabailii]CDH14427.1 related to Alpha-1,2-mannosyltransferase MNN5 [Zygosaccharomyces bailii ISA1307]